MPASHPRQDSFRFDSCIDITMNLLGLLVLALMPCSSGFVLSTGGSDLHQRILQAEDTSSSPSLSPSIATSSSPSMDLTSHPSISAKTLTTPLLAMDIAGLLVKDMENNIRAQRHWSSTTSRLVRSYWENKDQNGFSPHSTIVNYKGVESLSNRKLRGLNEIFDPFSKDQNLPIARIIYSINFEVSGAQSESIPEELLSVPTIESYIISLKENDPTAFNIFQNVNATNSRGIYTKQGESPVAPTLVPTPAPSVSFPTSQSLHNGESNAMKFVMVFLITCIVLSGIYGLKIVFRYLPKGDLCNICCFHTGNSKKGYTGEMEENRTRYPIELPDSSFSNDTFG